jgi:hypothetical protein
MTTEQQDQAKTLWRGRTGIALLGFAAIAAFFLWTEHRAHLLGALPYLIFLLCPLLHLFHRGHGGHGSRNDRSARQGG